MAFRRYESIAGIHKVSGKFFNKGDIIQICEKMDGSNFSFENDNGRIRYYSRNNEVTGGAFRGAIPYVEQTVNPSSVGEGFTFYGEWLVRHRVGYKKEIQNTFVMFDIYNHKENTYEDQEIVRCCAKLLGFTTPEIFYEGEYVSIEHIRQFVGQSNTADGMQGEGVVIRNLTQGTICKWVRDGFMEHQVSKQVKQVNNEIISYIEQFMTEGRIAKFLHKGIDEGAYDSFDKKNIGAIMKFCVNGIVHDVLIEEYDVILPEHREEFIKVANKRMPLLIKGVIANESN